MSISLSISVLVLALVACGNAGRSGDPHYERNEGYDFYEQADQVDQFEQEYAQKPYDLRDQHVNKEPHHPQEQSKDRYGSDDMYEEREQYHQKRLHDRYEPYETQTSPGRIVPREEPRDKYEEVPLTPRVETSHGAPVERYHDESGAGFESRPQFGSHGSSQGVPQDNSNSDSAGPKKVGRLGQLLPSEMVKNSRKLYAERAQPVINIVKGELGQIYQRAKKSKHVGGGLNRLKSRKEALSRQINSKLGRQKSNSNSGSQGEEVNQEPLPVYQYSANQ